MSCRAGDKPPQRRCGFHPRLRRANRGPTFGVDRISGSFRTTVRTLIPLEGAIPPVKALRRRPLLLSLLGLPALHACTADRGTGAGEVGADLGVTPVELSALEGGGMPHLSPLEDGGVLLSWLAPGGYAGEAGGADGALTRLRVVRYHRDRGFDEPRTVTERRDFFVNWADFPSVVEVAPGRWAAHWLQRGPAGGYDYAVHVSTSEDGGASWTDDRVLHDDASAT